MLFRAVLLVCFLASSHASLWNFFSMSKCVLQRSVFDYVGYGCNCGLRQKNEIPVDDADRCCLRHKACYARALEGGDCPHWYQLYFTNYGWECEERTAVCKGGSNEESDNVCGVALCQCDSELFGCLAQAEYQEPKPTCPAAMTSDKSVKGF